MNFWYESGIMRIAVIDTGSNTIRLAVFEVCPTYQFPSVAFHSVGNSPVTPSTSSPLQKAGFGEIKEIIDVKNTAGLSNYVNDGVFTKSGVEKAVRVLRDHVQCAENLGCDKTYIFATAVLRNVNNSKSIVSEIESGIGRKIEVLGGEEEAKLGLNGAFCDSEVRSGMLIDLGGGSCELTKFCDENFESVSLDVGCVSVYSQFVTGILPTKKECEKISTFVKGKIENSALKLKKQASVWGIGGSVRAIAKFTREMKNLEKTPKHVRLTDIEDMLGFLKKDENSFAHVAVKSVPDRIHSVVTGCLIIGEILKATGVAQLDICKHGLREGYLLSKLTTSGHVLE